MNFYNFLKILISLNILISVQLRSLVTEANILEDKSTGKIIVFLADDHVRGSLLENNVQKRELLLNLEKMSSSVATVSLLLEAPVFDGIDLNSGKAKEQAQSKVREIFNLSGNYRVGLQTQIYDRFKYTTFLQWRLPFEIAKNREMGLYLPNIDVKNVDPKLPIYLAQMALLGINNPDVRSMKFKEIERLMDDVIDLIPKEISAPKRKALQDGLVLEFGMLKSALTSQFIFQSCVDLSKAAEQMLNTPINELSLPSRPDAYLKYLLLESPFLYELFDIMAMREIISSEKKVTIVIAGHEHIKNLVQYFADDLGCFLAPKETEFNMDAIFASVNKLL